METSTFLLTNTKKFLQISVYLIITCLSKLVVNKKGYETIPNRAKEKAKLKTSHPGKPVIYVRENMTKMSQKITTL